MCQLCGFILCFLYFHFIVPGKSDCFNFSVDSWFKNFSFTFKHIYLLDNVFLLQDRKGRLRVWPPHLYLVMGTFMCQICTSQMMITIVFVKMYVTEIEVEYFPNFWGFLSVNVLKELCVCKYL